MELLIAVVLIVLVAVVTVIGHLLWRLLAALFGYQVRTLRRGAESTVKEDLRATPLQTELARLYDAGLIDLETRAKVLDAIRVDRQRATMDRIMPGPVAAPPPLPVQAIGLDEAQAPWTSESASLLPAEPRAPAVSVPPPVPPVPRRARPVPAAPSRPFSQVLASFMEEKNIRWGELVGGLLIVGCSIALVISFWAQIAQRPFFKFSLFTAVTASLFGLGLYSEHRWKLPTTSRGILLIATLLVSLNFLAFAAFSGGASPGVVSLGAQLVALALFAWLVWLSSKVIAPIWPAPLTIGTVALAASLLALRGISPRHPAVQELIPLSLLPMICYLGASAGMLARAARWRSIHANAANALLMLLGVLSFAVALPMGLLVSSAPDLADALRQLAPVISLGGVPALVTGLILWKRITAPRLAMPRLAGTTVAILGAGVLVCGVALAWPQPAGMLPVALCDFVVLTAIAFLFEIPAAHVLALLCLAAGWIIGFHLFALHVAFRPISESQTFEALTGPSGGTALVPLVALTLATAQFFRRVRRDAEAGVYEGVSFFIALISLALVSAGGFLKADDPFGATWVYAAYGGLALLFAWMRNLRGMGWLGWGMLLASLVQGFVTHRIVPNSAPAAVLACAALAAVANLVWLAVDRLRAKEALPPPAMVGIQGWVNAILIAICLIPAVGSLIVDPADTRFSADAAGNVWGWAAILAGMVAIFAIRLRVTDGLRLRTIAFAVLAIVAVGACSVQRWSSFGAFGWLGFHTLLAGCGLAAWSVLGFGWWMASRRASLLSLGSVAQESAAHATLDYQRPPMTSAERTLARLAVSFGGELLVRAVVRWASAIGIVVVALSLWAVPGDPMRAWPSVAGLMAIAGLTTLLAWWAWRPTFLHGSALLLNLSASVWFLRTGLVADADLIKFLCLNAIALSLPAMAWLVLDLQLFRRGPLLRARALPPIHRVAAILSLVIFPLAIALNVLDHTAGEKLAFASAAVASLGALWASLLWDSEARGPVAGLFILGLLAIALAIESATPDPLRMAWAAGPALAGYLGLTAALWLARRPLADVATGLKMPIADRDLTSGWLPTTIALLAQLVVALAFWAGFTFAQASYRLIGAGAALLQVAALAALAHGQTTNLLRKTALMVAAIAGVACGWAWLSPTDPAILDRCVTAFAIFTLAEFLYVVALPQLLKRRRAAVGGTSQLDTSVESPWLIALRDVRVGVGVLAGASLAATLGAEVWYQIDRGAVPMRPIEIAIVLLALLGACVASLAIAIRKTDLPDRTRMGCVYAAEAFLALAFAHVRLTMPYLFHGFFAAYWPLVVMAIAYAGVGAGEILRQRGQRILGHPIQQTGILLPLVPVLAFWTLPPAVDLGVLLATVCVLYTMVAVLRQSFGFALLAVLAGNGA